jgi:hypothetical protein
MQSQQLSTVNGSGNQSVTQDPQTVTSQTAIAGTQTSNVQSQPSVNLFTGTGGVSLNPVPLTTVNLTSTKTTTVATPAPKPTTHINYAMLSVSTVLFIVAVALFWFTSRSAKSTTE